MNHHIIQLSDRLGESDQDSPLAFGLYDPESKIFYRLAISDLCANPEIYNQIKELLAGESLEKSG